MPPGIQTCCANVKLILVLGTVKAHNHHIFRKLDVANRVQAIARARELNLI